MSYPRDALCGECVRRALEAVGALREVGEGFAEFGEYQFSGRLHGVVGDDVERDTEGVPAAAIFDAPLAVCKKCGGEAAQIREVKRAAQFACEKSHRTKRGDGFAEIHAAAVFDAVGAQRVIRVANAEQPQSCSAAFFHEFVDEVGVVVATFVGTGFVDGAEVKCNIAEAARAWKLLKKAEVPPPEKHFVVACADQRGLKDVVVFEPDFFSEPMGHRDFFRAGHTAVIVAGGAEFHIVMVDSAAFVEIVAARIREDMDAFVGGAPRADIALPLHEFVAKLTGVRPCDEVAAWEQSLPCAREGELDFLDCCEHKSGGV